MKSRRKKIAAVVSSTVGPSLVKRCSAKWVPQEADCCGGLQYFCDGEEPEFNQVSKGSDKKMAALEVS